MRELTREEMRAVSGAAWQIIVVGERPDNSGGFGGSIVGSGMSYGGLKRTGIDYYGPGDDLRDPPEDYDHLIEVIGERPPPPPDFLPGVIEYLRQLAANPDFHLREFVNDLSEEWCSILEPTNAEPMTDEEIEDLLRDRSADGRDDDVVYITAHEIMGFLPEHIAIEFNNRTLSAGGSWGGFLGSLISGEGRGSDGGNNNYTVGVVIPPAGLTGQQYFDLLWHAEGVYRDHLDYDALAGVYTLSPGWAQEMLNFPGAPGALSGYMLYAVVAYYSNLANSLTDGHNSNSYVSGLIQATGGTVVVNMQDGQRIEIDWGDYIGGDQPVLPFHFGEPNPGCPNR